MKKKLTLKDLKVMSFVTNLSELQSQNAMGGQQTIICIPTNNRGICQTIGQTCPECYPPYEN